MRREFYLQDDRSNKFWTIEVQGKELIATNGRVGAQPRETRTSYESAEVAEKAADKAVLAKRRKGYLEGDLTQLPDYRDDLPPRFVRINLDDYDAQYVGKTADGGQFFLTFPFVPRISSSGGSFVALYLFDEFGLLREARIHEPSREGLNTQSAVDEFAQSLLNSLGKLRYCDIKVAPFAVERFGIQFGLIYEREDIDEDDDPYCSVIVEPGNYMAFNPPWDGDYDT